MLEARKRQLAEKLLEKHAFPGVGTISNMAASPLRAIGEGLSRALLGAKAEVGPMAGKRLRFSNMSQVNEAKFKELKASGKTPVRSYESPTGQQVYMKENYRPGGLVGAAMDHPIIATGLGAGGLYFGGNIARNVSAMRAQANMQQQQQQQPMAAGPGQAWG